MSDKIEKRSSARPLYKDIAINFFGHRELLGTYALILNNVAWGDHYHKKYRKQCNVGEFLTTYKEFSEIAGIDNRTLQRELLIIQAMGLIRIAKNGIHISIFVLNPQNCSISAIDAAKIFPKNKRNKLGDGLREKGKHVRRRPISHLGDGLTGDTNLLGDRLTEPDSCFIREEEKKEEHTEKKRGEEKPSVETDAPPLDNLISIDLDGLKTRRDEIYAQLDPLYSFISEYEFSEEEAAEVAKVRLEVGVLNSELDSILSVLSKSNKKAPPEASKDVLVQWYEYGAETFKTQSYPIEKYRKAIAQIMNKTMVSEHEVLSLFLHIKSGKDPMLNRRFRFPWDWEKRWEKEKEWRFIDEGFSSMNTKHRRKN